MMSLIRLFMKVLLLPIMLILFVLRILVKIGIELSSIVLTNNPILNAISVCELPIVSLIPCGMIKEIYEFVKSGFIRTKNEVVLSAEGADDRC